jgi:hypothetical protein
MPDGGFDPMRLAPAVERVDYTVKKGEVSLAVYRKRAAGAARRPVLFLVHGSSNSALSSFDLSAPGGEYSTMNVFAELGYDVWTMDHENYKYFYASAARTKSGSKIRSAITWQRLISRCSSGP